MPRYIVNEYDIWWRQQKTTNGATHIYIYLILYIHITKLLYLLIHISFEFFLRNFIFYFFRDFALSLYSFQKNVYFFISFYSRSWYCGLYRNRDFILFISNCSVTTLHHLYYEKWRRKKKNEIQCVDFRALG